METALVIVLDDGEPFDDIRREFAAGTFAKGIPFHVTLLYPFASDLELTEAVLEDVRVFFAAQEPFEFWLTRIATWPGVVYAVPEPDRPLRECMLALHVHFPQWPPYGGSHDEVVPHATLGEDVAAAAVGSAIERRLKPHLPKRYSIDAAALLEEFEPDRWRMRAEFPFGG